MAKKEKSRQTPSVPGPSSPPPRNPDPPGPRTPPEPAKNPVWTWPLFTPAEPRPEKRSPSSDNPTPTTPGLTITSDPSGAEVLVNGGIRGQTPLRLENYGGQTLRITWRLGGYRSVEKDYAVPANESTVGAALDPLKAFLVFPHDPPETVMVNGTRFEGPGPGKPLVLTGKNLSANLSLVRYGFENQDFYINLAEGETRVVEYPWTPVSLSASEFYPSGHEIYPHSRRANGTVKLVVKQKSASVVELKLLDGPTAGTLPLTNDFGHLSSYEWDGLDPQGNPLPEGLYRFEAVFTSPYGERVVKNTTVYLHQTRAANFTNLDNTTSGLMFAGDAQTLEAGTTQITLSGRGAANADFYRIPFFFSAASGLARGFQAELTTGITYREDSDLNLFQLGAGFKDLLAPGLAFHGGVLLSGYFTDIGTLPAWDDRGWFPGVNAGIETAVGDNHLKFLLGADLQASPTRPLSVLEDSTNPALWAYFRTGVQVQGPGCGGGVSALVRTTPFFSGQQFFYPELELGAEFHFQWDPDSPVVNLFCETSWSAVNNWYLAPGASVSFFF